MFRRRPTCTKFWAVLFLLCPGCLFAQAAEQNSTEKGAEIAATAQMQAGQFQAACEMLRRAVHQYPESAELWNLLGISQSELQDDAAAKDSFERGLHIAPNSTSLNENLGFLFFREANYRAAKRCLQKAVNLGSQNPGVRFSLAASKLRTGEAVQALQELKALEKPLGNVSDYWVERGRAELPGNAEQAESSFARALQLDPGSVAAENGAATAAEREGLDEKALAYLIEARKKHPDDVPTLLHFGTVCLRRDLGIDALAAAKRAYELQPTNDYALYLLARANVSQQDWQQAYDLFDQFTKRRPRFAPAYYAKGWVDLKLDKIDDARQNLRRCLELDPDLSDARADLAQLELDNGNLDAAQQLFEKVLEQNPRNAKANVGLGDLMLRQGKLEEAQRYLQTAIAADPKQGAAHYKLSQVFLRKHDTADAKKERELALTLNAEAKQASKTPLRLAMPDGGTVP